MGHPSRAISLYRDNVELVYVVYIALTEGCGLLNSLLDFFSFLFFYSFSFNSFFFGGGGEGLFPINKAYNQLLCRSTQSLIEMSPDNTKQARRDGHHIRVVVLL